MEMKYLRIVNGVIVSDKIRHINRLEEDQQVKKLYETRIISKQNMG